MDHLTFLILKYTDFLFLVAENVAAYLLLDIFFERKRPKLTVVIIFTMQVLLCGINHQLQCNLFFKKGIFWMLLFAGAQILYAGSILAKLLCVTLSNLLFYSIDLLVIIGMQYRLEEPMQAMLQNAETVCAIALISKTILIIVTFIYRKYRIGKQNKFSILQRGIVIPTILALICCILMIEFTGWIIKSAVRPPLEVIVGTACICAVSFATLFAVNMTERTEKMVAHMRLLQQKQMMQLKNINDLKDAYAAQRKNAHEFNRHLTMIEELLQQGKNTMAQNYIMSVIEHQAQHMLVVNTHNAMVDTILNRFYNTAQKQNVDVNFNVNDLSHFCMPADDTVVLLTNLLDNALEACEKLKDNKKADVQMIYDEKKQETFLSIRNTSNPVQIENNKIQTTKKPTIEHGYGLKNVEDILKKHHAEEAIDYEDGWFQFTALIPQKTTAI